MDLQKEIQVDWGPTQLSGVHVGMVRVVGLRAEEVELVHLASMLPVDFTLVHVPLQAQGGQA